MKLWHPPTYIGFQAPVRPPPGWSSPAAVSARIREFCGRAWFAKAMADKAFASLYGEFRLVCERAGADADEIIKPAARLACPVADTHVSKWQVVRKGHRWTLKLRKGT